MKKESEPRIGAAQACYPDDYRDVHQPCPFSPFLGWEWLERPALIVIGIGMIGLLLSCFGQTALRVAFFRFPPLWACCVLVLGGIALLLISILAGRTHQAYVPSRGPGPKHWRTY